MTEPRMIFCLTTGRSGTAYLTQMFRFLPETSTHHESPPEFERVARLALETGEQATFWLEQKLPAIRAQQERLPIYIETSHVFKYLARGLLEAGEIADLIFLRRPYTEVAHSYWSRGHYPGRTEVGLRYFAKPDDPYTVLPVSDWESLTDYQLCYWYTIATEIRCVQLAEMYRQAGARVVGTTLAEVTRPSGFKALIDDLELPEPDWARHAELYERRVNALNAKRRKLPATLEAQERAVLIRALVTLAEGRSI